MNHDLLNQALHAGSAAFQCGDWNSALEYGRTATTLAPGHPGGHSLLGLALLQLGQLAPAITELEAAITRDKNNPVLLGNLAQAYTMAGRHADAHQTFRRAQRLAPGHWHYAQGAAVALARQGKPAEAESLLSRLAERHPRQAALLYNLGNVQLELGKTSDAEKNFQEALRISPEDFDVRLSLGAALHRQSQFAAAATIYRDCISAQPAWIPPRLNLISVLIDDGRFGEAEEACQQLIERAPDLAEAHRFLGAALGHQGKQLQALAAYRRAAACAPDDPLSLRSYGGALAECARLNAALRILARADALEPDAIAMQQLRGMFDLTHGMFSDGWSAYRHRPAFLLLAKKWADPRIAQDLPSDLTGKHVLVRREQGLGDELFFLRQLPRLKARGAKITVQASAKIAALISRAAVADAIIHDLDAPPEDVDIHIFCGDLPYALQNSPASPLPWRDSPSELPDYRICISAYCPPPAPSLRIHALPEAVARIREQLDKVGPPPYIGITWRAGTAAGDQRGADWVLSKEVPLTALGTALKQSCGSLIALQRHAAEGEIDTLSAACGRPVADFTALNEQLEDMQALLELLDEYIGVSNTNMHLRAATGRPARVLVPNPSEWRWMQHSDRSPWFPDFRLYRQSLHGDWSHALAQLAQDLACLN